MRKTKGITLIALIITIIVMLVLVGVTVSVLVDSDLIGAAEKTADKYKTEYEKEQTLGEITIGDKVYNSLSEYTEEINGENISFTIEGTTYTVKKGTKWKQFIASDANANNTFFCDEGTPVFYRGIRYGCLHRIF